MSRVALAPGNAREYETIFVLRPQVDKAGVDALNGRVGEAINTHAGKLTQVEVWGRRRLAYTIQRHTRGVYVYIKYVGRGETVNELERHLRLVDNVIRYQTVVVRDNVSLDGLQVADEDIKPDFDLTDFDDEPPHSLERELGLEPVHGDRSGRGRRDDRDRGPRPDRDGRPDEEPEGGEDEAKVDAEATAADADQTRTAAEASSDKEPSTQEPAADADAESESEQGPESSKQEG